MPNSMKNVTGVNRQPVESGRRGNLSFQYGNVARDNGAIVIVIV